MTPIARLLPLLLQPQGGRLLLADPPSRTAHNRQRFLELLCDPPAASAVQWPHGAPLRLVVDESSVQQCGADQLDPEMAGGVACDSVPVQLLVLRSVVGNDTVGVKAA